MKSITEKSILELIEWWHFCAVHNTKGKGDNKQKLFSLKMIKLDIKVYRLVYTKKNVFVYMYYSITVFLAHLPFAKYSRSPTLLANSR